jgi:membrane protein
LEEQRLSFSADIKALRNVDWRRFSKRLWTRINEHDVFGNAAQLSYYFLLALFPLLLFLVTLLGYFAEAGSQLRNSLISYLATVMPYSAVQLVHATLDEISDAKGGGKLSFGLLAALWAASTGMGAITDTLNTAYHVKETRPWWKVRLVAIVLTIALSVLIMVALALILYGNKIAEFLTMRFGLGRAAEISGILLQWLIGLAFMFISFNLVYRFAPNNLGRRHHRFSRPGAAIAVVLWLLISFGFRVYLHFFNSYSVTYGSLGALIVLMLWFYLSGVAILIGGEINSELESEANLERRTSD